MARTRKKAPDPAIGIPVLEPVAFAKSGVAIKGELTIYQVLELKSILQKALDQAQAESSPLQLDFSAVTECDGAGLQLLIALAKSARASGTAVEVQGIPADIAAIFDSYGVASYFSGPMGGAAP